MKFVCERKMLAEAIAGVSRAVSASSSVTALQGICFKAEGFAIELTGYDLEMAITTSLPANVTEPGGIVLPAKLVGDMVRSLPCEQVSVESDDSLATRISGESTEYNLVGISAAEFPSLPAPGADFAFEMDAAEMAGMIGMTNYAVSADDKRPALTGELFDITPGELTLVALDGFRVAIARHPVITERTLAVVVPGKTVAEVARLLGDGDRPVRVDANNRFIVFSCGAYTVMSRLIEGEFFNYKNAVPEGYKTRVTVDVALLEKAVERCAVIINERLKNPLRITFGGDIDIRCQTPLGRVSDALPADIEGEALEIGFNYRYVLDALRNCGTDRVVLELSGQLSPVKILPTDGDEFVFIVLPVRFRND